MNDAKLERCLQSLHWDCNITTYQLSQTHPISHFLRASRKYVVWWCTSWWTRYFFSFQGNKYDHLKQHVGTGKSFDDYGVSSTIWKEINEIVSNFLRNINWYSRPVQIELLSMNLVFSMASNTLLKVVLLFYNVLFAEYPFHNDWADFLIWNQFFVIFLPSLIKSLLFKSNGVLGDQYF